MSESYKAAIPYGCLVRCRYVVLQMCKRCVGKKERKKK